MESVSYTEQDWLEPGGTGLPQVAITGVDVWGAWGYVARVDRIICFLYSAMGRDLRKHASKDFVESGEKNLKKGFTTFL